LDAIDAQEGFCARGAGLNLRKNKLIIPKRQKIIYRTFIWLKTFKQVPSF
jgi:hypothetical protein